MVQLFVRLFSSWIVVLTNKYDNTFDFYSFKIKDYNIRILHLFFLLYPNGDQWRIPLDCHIHPLFMKCRPKIYSCLRASFDQVRLHIHHFILLFHVYSSPRLMFHRTFTIGIRICLSWLTLSYHDLVWLFDEVPFRINLNFIK